MSFLRFVIANTELEGVQCVPKWALRQSTLRSINRTQEFFIRDCILCDHSATIASSAAL